MKKVDKKYYFLLLILNFVTIVSMLIGTMYSYYSRKGDYDSTKVYVKDVVLLMQYENGNSLYISDIDNGLDYNYYFSIINNSSEYGVKYILDFDRQSVNDKTIKGLKFNLSGNKKNINNEDILINYNGDLTNINKIAEGYISPNQIHYYTLNVKYDGQINNEVLIGRIILQKAID